MMHAKGGEKPTKEVLRKFEKALEMKCYINIASQL